LQLEEVPTFGHILQLCHPIFQSSDHIGVVTHKIPEEPWPFLFQYPLSVTKKEKLITSSDNDILTLEEVVCKHRMSHHNK
jgi:hypothetical protein